MVLATAVMEVKVYAKVSKDRYGFMSGRGLICQVQVDLRAWIQGGVGVAAGVGARPALMRLLQALMARLKALSDSRERARSSAALKARAVTHTVVHTHSSGTDK